MTKTEDQVLVREIGKLAGFLGGFGTRIAARRLPVEEAEDLLVVDAPLTSVSGNVLLILQSIGRMTDEFASEKTTDTISAIVGSGHMNLNPTIVHVRFIESSDQSTTISLRALAKEGLVKQQSAKRATERILALISTRYAEQALGADSI